MQVILEAVAGPVTGRRIEVKPGTILRIGRTARADYALAEDDYLSGLHFAVEFDGAQCRVRDLGSSNGTFINGSRVLDQVVHQGDSLTAGGSTFAIHIDASAPPAPAFTKTAPTPLFTPAKTQAFERPAIRTAAVAASELWPGFSQPQTALLRNLYGPGLPVFALLDASKDSRIPAFLDASGEPYVPVDPAGRAPVYLAAPSPQGRLLDVLIKDGWGRSWCSYLSAPIPLEEACAHLAGFLTLYTIHGRPLTFRFWDPRILRVLAPLMPAEEAASFFGPFNRIVLEGDRPEVAVELTVTPNGLVQRALMLV
jgi:hypothetical protein